MLTTDSPNNNIPASAPPPPPSPLPPEGLKNWKLPQDNGNSKKPSNVATSGISSRAEPKKGQSKQQSSLDFAESRLFKEKQEEHNVNSETADEGSKNSIHVKNPETRNSAQSKEEDNASDKTKNDRSNTKQGVPKKPMTEQHNGVHSDSENQKSSVAEQKKATGLKYSIAILLLCTSSAVAGVYTYFIISAVLSGVAVPVLFAVIASVSSLVVLSLAVYLINSFVSAINNENKIDLGRKQSGQNQSQNSELRKETKRSEHSNNTPTSPPAPSPNTILRIENADMPKAKIGNQTGDRSAMLAQIKEGDFQLKKVKDNNVPKTDNKLSNQSNNNKNPQPKDLMTDLTKALQKRRNGVAGEEENSVQLSDGAYAKISSMIPPPKNQSSSSSSNNSDESWDTDDEYSIPPTPQSDGKKRRDSSDSGHESDDNEKSKPTSPLHSVPKAGKPLVPPKTAGLQTKSEASPGAQVKNVDPTNSEMQKPSRSFDSAYTMFGGKASPRQLQSDLTQKK